MIECRRNIELFFLLRRLTPDFRTISDFRKENPNAIRKVFLSFTRLCLSLHVYEQESIAIDGSKFRAVNGNKRMYNDTILASKLERIETKLDAYLEQMDQMDEEEGIAADGDEAKTGQKAMLEEKTQDLRDRKETYLAYAQELKDTGETQKLTTDPQARMMHSHKDGYHCCYNVQTAVGSHSHFILDYQVTNHVNDQGILHDFCNTLKTTMDRPILEVVADKGYDCKEEILSCILDGVLAYVGFKDDQGERLCAMDHQAASLPKQLRDSTDPADIRTCLHAGVLPTCYAHSNLQVEVHGLGEIGAFTRGEDKQHVTCPMGHTLNKTKDKRAGSVYVNRKACRQCTNRCTASNRHKEVYFGPNSHCVAARMYGEEPAVNLPPPDFTPTNSFYKKHPVEKTVLLRIADDVEKQKQRLCISEHPFGTVKWYHGAHYVLCKGIPKVTAELGLSFLAYNLRRAINWVGTRALLDAIEGV